ncbi:MAG TPA: ABC transporter permease, partial [Candidatus Binatia bacterium]
MYRRTWRLNILPNFFEPVFYLLSIGLGVGSYIDEMGGTGYLAFLAPGLVSVAVMNGASFEVTYNIFVRLTFEKAYDAMLTTPIEPDDVLAGEVLWAITRAAFRGELSPLLFWDLAYMLGASALLLAWARTGMRRRLTN